MKLSNHKLKLLYLMKILMEMTDEQHSITVPKMIEELDKYGISAERKSIYSDIEYLKLFGLDICSRKSVTNDYYLASRRFELPELKLLVDSVQSSKFITKKKSLELIKKIETLTSNENAKLLQRQVYVTNRVKTLNEKIYYNVDKIHDAIAANKKITFKYFDTDVNKQKVYRKSGDLYTESPIALTWDDENYYLITYKQKYESYVHYRVDKMEGIDIIEEPRETKEGFDLSAYAKKMFQMYNGDEIEVSIRFENELVGVIYDRFGLDVPLVGDGEGHFICHVKVAVSPQFLAWVFSFGDRAEILSPSEVAGELQKMACKVLGVYSGKKKTDC